MFTMDTRWNETWAHFGTSGCSRPSRDQAHGSVAVSRTSAGHTLNPGTAMGAWSADNFGNDDAADWAYGLEETNDLSLVEATIAAALSTDEEYL